MTHIEKAIQWLRKIDAGGGPGTQQAQDLLVERDEIMQLLANALSSGEGWSVKDEERARQLVDAHFSLNGSDKS